MKNRLYRCPSHLCSKAYSAQVNLKRHIDCCHLQVKSFTCNFCSKQLSSQQNFREHLYIHTGEKPFSCKVCGAFFRQGSQFSQHKKLHKQRKPDPRPVPDLNVFVKLTLLTAFSTDRFFNPAALAALRESPLLVCPVLLPDINLKQSAPHPVSKARKLIL